MIIRAYRSGLLLLVLALLLAACGGAATPPAQPDDASLRSVTMAFAFIPNVQFAPFYVADSKGYYAEAGLDVSFDYNFETDVVQRVASWPDSEVPFAMAGGLSVMLAREQSLPVVMTMLQYQQFPVVFFSKAEVAELEAPEDLQGHSVGIPGRFGASYYALLALLYASDIEEGALDVQEVGFNQFPLIVEDTIEVASGYAMNEPVKLREEGIDVSVLRVADFFPLVADGIVTNEQLIEQDPELVRAFVQASLRGLRDTLDNPEEAFALSLPYIQEAELDSLDFERAVLQESLPYWESTPLGANNPEQWEQSHTFLLDLELLGAPLTVEDAYTNEFLPE